MAAVPNAGGSPNPPPGRPSAQLGARQQGAAESVRVAVRVRPFNEREQARSQVPVPRMSPAGRTVTIRSSTSARTGDRTFVSERLQADTADLRALIARLMAEKFDLSAELAEVKSENERLRASNAENQRKLALAERREATLTQLAVTEQLSAEMKRLLHALNIDVEEQLRIERNRTESADSEAHHLRGKNDELLEAQEQQEFCDLVEADLTIKTEGIEAIEKRLDFGVHAGTDMNALQELDELLQRYILDKIPGIRFASPNLEGQGRNIIKEAMALQSRVAAAKGRLTAALTVASATTLLAANATQAPTAAVLAAVMPEPTAVVTPPAGNTAVNNRAPATAATPPASTAAAKTTAPAPSAATASTVTAGGLQYVPPPRPKASRGCF